MSLLSSTSLLAINAAAWILYPFVNALCGRAKYVDCHAQYKDSNAGMDQLAEIVETLKRNPDSRRIVLSAWNVSH